MMMRLNEVSLKEVPKFVKLIETSIPASGKKSANTKDIIDDVFNVSVERGLNEKECSMLLHLFLTSTLSSSDKFKLLQNLVPEDKLPAADIRSFMTWFISNFKRLDSFSLSTSSHILQWIIGLLEYNRVDSEEIHNFYDDFFTMLEYPSLIPYVAKLLCKLTTPDDVTGQTVRSIFFYGDLNNKYILAVLNVFKGYKPHLMLEEVKKVDVVSVLNSVPQTMDSVMRVRAICTRRPQMAPGTVGVCEVLTRNTSYFKEEFNKISSLIPLPSYNFEGMDKLAACYPNSIEEACQHFSRVPIPQKILSLLHNDAGFFTIMYQGIEVQMRFQNSLLQTLQNALIYQELKASSEDVEFLLRRLHCFQTFMQQGIPCVSVFVSGYLMNWDGVDYRYSILKLIEWSSFHSFRALWSNILRPLHIQFVTNNINMKKEIIQVLTNLIRNMFADLSRVQRGVPFPFLKRGPKWTKEPETMLEPLIAWTQNLITLGLAVEPDSSQLLMEAIHFYKMVNTVEAASGLKMFTVVSEEVVLQSLLSQNPNTILRICGLLLRYHQEFLPQLRTEQPHFYKQCRAKISLTSNYAQQIIYFLQNGQVLTPRKENRMIMSHVLNESLAARRESISLDLHLYFVSSYVIFESKKNFLNLAHPNDKRTSLELATVHLREIKEFINFFSPSVE